LVNRDLFERSLKIGMLLAINEAAYHGGKAGDIEELSEVDGAARIPAD
jgi:hypothetical protein